MDKTQVKNFIESLREEIIFYYLNDEEVETILPYFEIKEYPENTVIFREGDSGDFIGFVISGKLEVKKQTEFKGNQIILAILGKGATVGELSMFDKHSRSATVETIEPTKLLILRQDAIEDIMNNHPPIAIKLLKALVRILSIRLRKLSERLTTIF
jgi:CRP-like cAMP-binding protein